MNDRPADRPTAHPPGSRSALDEWADRFEQAGVVGRLALLGGGAVRVAAGLVERALDRAATAVVDAQDAIQKELDPNVSDARVIEETRVARRRTGDASRPPDASAP